MWKRGEKWSNAGVYLAHSRFVKLNMSDH